MSEQSHWFAVHTRSRHEKKAETELRCKGVETYLPMVEQIRQWSDRKVKVEFPLFTGYLFVRVDLSPRTHLEVVQTKGVISMLGVHGEPTPIPAEQIEAAERLVLSKIGFEQHAYLKAGQKVRVRGGALDGVEGVLVSVGSDRKLVISVDLIRQSLAVSLDGYDVEPL